MRVVSGSARGTVLQSLKGDRTRPTTDKVKEAMFSIINFYIGQASVLDLFAGSGGLGIEALSRGADRCVFLDNNREAAAIVTQNLEKTRLSHLAQVEVCDYKNFLIATKNTFDIILLDPPYNRFMCDEALGIIYERGLLNDGGIIVCETEFGEVVTTDFILKKDYKYGNTKLSVYTKGE